MSGRRRRTFAFLGISVAMLSIAWVYFSLSGSSTQTGPASLDAQIKITPKPAGPKAVLSPGRRRSDKTNTPLNISEDEWQVIYIENQRVGYSHTNSESITRNKQTIVRTTTDERVRIKRNGDTLEFTVIMKTEEAENGDLLSYDLEIRNPPAAPVKAVGVVKGNYLDVRTTIAGTTRRSSVPWRSGIKSPAYQDRLIKNSPLKPGERKNLRVFFPEVKQVVSISIAADRLRNVKLLDNKKHQLLKIRVSSSLTPQIPVRAYLDANGKVIKTESILLGKQMATYQVSAAEAMQKLSDEGFDLGLATLIPIKGFRRGHRARKAVFRITTPGQNPQKSFPVGLTQSVKTIDDDSLELTVTAIPIPRKPKSVAGPAGFLESTRFLQCDDVRVVSHARSAAGSISDPAIVAARLEKYVHQRVSKKNFSTAFASAAEVAQNLEGDCTEHAVLLTAMLRALKIPARVAVGLVYIEGIQAFGGHMWTEAWIDGRWIPLDATLGRGGIGAGHLKMSDSSLADDAPTPISAFLSVVNVMGNIKIEIVSTDGVAAIRD